MAVKRYKRPYRAKRKKPIFFKASFWCASFFIVGIAGSAWCAIFSPLFEVKDIQVSGTQKIKDQECITLLEEQVKKEVAFIPSKSLLLFDLKRAKDELMARFPQAQNITIERKFPSTIYASVQERQPIAVFEAGGQKFFIDENGVAFETVSSENNLFIVGKGAAAAPRIGEAVVQKDLLVKVIKIKVAIEAAAKLGLARALIVSAERVNFTTKDGWMIYANPQKDIDWQAAKLEAVLSDKDLAINRASLEYIDLRFTRVYVKPK